MARRGWSRARLAPCSAWHIALRSLARPGGPIPRLLFKISPIRPLAGGYMAVAQQQLGQAIYDLIFDSLTLAPAGTPPAASAALTMLSLSVPGLPLDPGEFANPWTPMNPGGDPGTAENFAWLVDRVPQISPVFTSNGSSVEAIYGEIVRASTPAALPAGVPGRDLIAARLRVLQRLSPSVQRAFRKLYTEATVALPRGGSLQTFLETPALRQYLDAREARDEAVTRYMVRLLQTNMRDPADQRRWAELSEELEEQIKVAAKAAADAGGTELERAMAALAASGGAGQDHSVAAIFEAARLSFELSKLGSRLEAGSTWHLTLAQPPDWPADEAPFVEVDLGTSRGLRLNPASRFKSFGGPGALSAGLWGYRARDTPRRQPIDGASMDLRVHFEFARVAVRRPWLDPSLFSLGGWAMAGRHRHDLSTGSLTGNPGIFPLLPSSIILARNLEISATWSRADSSFIRERLGRQDLTFGPFALAGSYRRPRAQASTNTSASFDGVNISAPGLQVIGWMSKLVPACPPLDG